MKGSRNVATSFLASRGAKFLIALPLVLAAFALLLQVRTYPPSWTVCLHPATDGSRCQNTPRGPQNAGLPRCGFAGSCLRCQALCCGCLDSTGLSVPSGQCASLQGHTRCMDVSSQ